jgi:hypothetical protein
MSTHEDSAIPENFDSVFIIEAAGAFYPNAEGVVNPWSIAICHGPGTEVFLLDNTWRRIGQLTHSKGLSARLG